MDPSTSFYKKLRISAVQEEIQGFKTIVFEDGHGIDYKAGQYLTLVKFENGEELRRSYSITSSPLLNEPLTIGVKRVENGTFSRMLVDRAKTGDEITSTGSGGFFTLPDEADAYQQLFFFAAGSGITPIYSMLKTALHAFPSLPVVLIYSNASVEKALFLSSLESLKKEHPHRFHLEVLFSNAADLSRARLNRDLLLFFLEHYVSANGKKTLFYICGPESYMRLCTYTLQAEGIPPADIKKENFYFTHVAKRDSSPPDKEDHYATIRLGKEVHTFVVHYPDSILKAAKREGILLPYSCEAGRCGNCVARCSKGTIWHSYNEVLTHKELQQGLILTCVGHPQGGDVELEM